MRKYTYSTQEAADIVGIHKKTLLYWLKIGKVKEPIREKNNHRAWTKEDIAELKKLKLETNEKRGRRKNGTNHNIKS